MTTIPKKIVKNSIIKQMEKNKMTINNGKKSLLNVRTRTKICDDKLKKKTKESLPLLIILETERFWALGKFTFNIY